MSAFDVPAVDLRERCVDAAIQENEACEAVVAEFRAVLAQGGAAEPILELCDEMSGRIALRRHLVLNRLRDEAPPRAKRNRESIR